MNSEKSLIRQAAPGLGITFTIALIALLTSSMHASFDSLVISVIFGMLVGNMLDDRRIFDKGIDVALKIFIPLGIALYGFQLRIATVNTEFFPGVLAVFALMFSVSYFISRGIGLDKSLSILISTGLSVCGASAIIVLAPIIGARKEDTSISVLSVMTVGLTGMLAYKVVGGMSGIHMVEFAFLSGTTLPMLGQVKVAAAAMGPDSLALALQYKLVRISALALVAGLGLVLSRGKNRQRGVPWFMVAFFAFAVAVNVFPKAAVLGDALKPIGSMSLSTALAAVGLSIDFESVTEKGVSPLLSAFLAWGILAVGVYLFLSVVMP